MMILFFTMILAVAVPSARPQPNLVGYIPVTIMPGTNVVENLPATDRYQPTLAGFAGAKAGDVIMWKDESQVFDGKTWSGPNGGEAKVPIPKRFTVFRTAKETDVWNLGIEFDMKKAEKR